MSIEKEDGILVAETIPYKDNKDRSQKTKEELSRNRTIEVWPDEKMIYSTIKHKKKINKKKRRKRR